MANENILDDSYSKIIFFTEMGISIVTLILCVYVLYISFQFQKYNTINAIMKIQLIITVMIHMIPYLFGPQYSKQETYEDSIDPYCQTQTLLLAVSMFNTTHFPIILTVITYISLNHPETLELKEKCLKWTLSIVSWFLALIGGLFVFFFCLKGAGEDLVCWLIKDKGIIALCIQTFVYLMIMIIILYKIKISIIQLIKSEEVQDDSGNEYMKSFKKFFFFSMMTLFSLIVEIVTGILSNSFKDSKKSKMPYFVLVFISCLIEILLYPTVLMIFCFKRVPIKDLFPCCQSNKKYQRDKTIITLLENS